MKGSQTFSLCGCELAHQPDGMEVHSDYPRYRLQLNWKLRETVNILTSRQSKQADKPKLQKRE